MANAVAKLLLDATVDFGQGVIDSTLEQTIRDLSLRQTIIPPTELIESEIIGSPLLELLVQKNRESFRGSSGISHVLYAPSSTGKTTALRYFVEVCLKKAKAPALMISGHGNADNYLEKMALALGVWEGREGRSEASWMASLVSAFAPKSGQNHQHAPVLVLDEFNLRGQDDKNLIFADGFMRFIYEKQFTVLFVTQNLDTAKALCSLNQWQKIGLPKLSVPERFSLKKGELPPTEYDWVSMQWTTLGLSKMVLSRTKFKSKFDNEVDKDGCLPWLEDVSTPTVAIFTASNRLAARNGGFFQCASNGNTRTDSLTHHRGAQFAETTRF